MPEIPTEQALGVKPRVMVVEDETIVALDLRYHLESLGYEVPAVVGNGIDAVERAVSLCPDLILMDIRLDGDVDGIEAASRLRQRLDVPVVFLTAHSDEQILQRAKEAEPHGYLLKPYHDRELQTTIEIALHKHRGEAALHDANGELERRVAARTDELRREIAERRRSEEAARRMREDLEARMAERTAQLQAANESLQREVAERERAEAALLRQTVTLSKTTTMLVEKDRLLQAFQKIGQALLSSLELDQILDTLATQVIRASIFRSIMISVVDAKNGRVEVARCSARGRLGQANGDVRPDGDIKGLGWALNAAHPIAEVTRSAELKVIEADAERPPNKRDLPESIWSPVTYHIPVCQGRRVVAVLTTGSEVSQKTEMLQRIAVMQPLLDQVAIALEHAHLYLEAQEQTRQLVRLERLRALGEMAVGVSHNLNNLLVAVLVPAQFLQKATNDPQILREANEIVAAGRRAADLVKRLHRAVHMHESETLEAVAINDIIREAVASTRPKWKDESEGRGLRVRLETQLDEVPLVQGIASELHEVFTNLIFNAVDALPEGGVVQLRVAAQDDGVSVQVRDNGIGMDEEVRRRVFEPFFTTKDDVGTGLGLSTVYNTVTRCGGRIDVVSAPGEGSTFTIQLPFWQADEPAAQDSEASAGEAVRSGRVLVVEDDETVRQVLDHLLAADHEVKTVGSGPEGLDEMASRGYDVVLIDLGMPEMPGDQVARRMRQLDAAAALVLITGWQLESRSEVLEHFDFHLQKPFNEVDEVQAVVSRAIRLRDERAAD